MSAAHAACTFGGRRPASRRTSPTALSERDRDERRDHVLFGTMKCQAHTLRNWAMLNPFTEVAHGDATDFELAEGAKNGDRASLEQLVLRHQAWIYNIAVRMVFHPQDAEEVTQEVLIKV